MAEFGAKYPCFKPEGSSTGVILGKLVSANLTVNLASGEIYADDALAEQVSEFSSGTLAMETDDLEDANASVVYGCSVSNGLVTYNKDDNAPYGELAYYKVLMRKGVKYYKAYYYPRAKAALGNDNAQTKGSSVTFQTTNTTFTIFADDNGDWRKTETFSTMAEAVAFINSMLSVSSSTKSADLSALSIGALELSPAFNANRLVYTTTTTNATNAITATPKDNSASVNIAVNGTALNGSASWDGGENVVTVTVVNGTATKLYTVIVTKTA